jgi:hypothetical protein
MAIEGEKVIGVLAPDAETVYADDLNVGEWVVINPNKIRNGKTVLTSHLRFVTDRGLFNVFGCRMNFKDDRWNDYYSRLSNDFKLEVPVQ